MDAVRIKRLLREHGYTIADFGRAIHRERAVASKIIHGQVKLQPAHAAPLARLTGLSTMEVLKMAGVDLAQTVAVPLISWVKATAFADVGEAVRFAEEYPRIHMDYPRETIFALDVAGDSMNRIAPEGSRIVVDFAEKTLRDRDLAVFSRDGETTFKRYRRTGDNASWLEPDSFNPDHGPLAFSDELEVLTIGRVVAIAWIARSS